MLPITLLLTTVDSHDDAHRLARELVARRLAACVQGSAPITSHYRWQGKQEESVEYRLQIKMLPERCEAAVAWLTAHHPYQTPEIVRLDGAASEGYARWMRVEQLSTQG